MSTVVTGQVSGGVVDWQSLAEHGAAATLVLDRNACIQSCSWTSMGQGYTGLEVSSLLDLTSDAHRSSLWSTFDRVIAHEQPASCLAPLRRRAEKDGWFEYRMGPLRRDGVVVGAVVIVSEVPDGERTRSLVDERDALAHRLEETAAQLRRNTEELERFASIASHDLQEPLRKIQAFGDRLASKFRDDLPGRGQDYVDRMRNAARRMQNLVSDLSVYSRLSTTKRSCVPVQLGALVSGLVAELGHSITDCGGEVEVGALPTIEADPMRMRHLFLNLITNALKFHRPDVPPIVRISADLAADDGDSERTSLCRIAVEDNGIGIDERFHQRIFGIFERLHKRNAYEGTGVGLAMCSRIVEQHGGTISVDSSLGEGATFTVYLPYKARTASVREKGQRA